MAKKYYDKEKYGKEQEELKKNLSQQISDEIQSFSLSKDKFVEYLTFSARFHEYSPKNRMLMMLSNPYTTFVASYMGFKEKGWQVKKGEEGMKIFVPVVVKTFPSPDKLKGTKKISEATPEEKKAIENGIIKVSSNLAFKIGTVFDIAQTTCPESEYPSLFSRGYEDIEHKNIYDALKSYSRKNKISFEEKDVKSISLGGYYVPSSNEITISETLKDTRKLLVGLHEFSHSLMHGDDTIRTRPTAQVEIEADGLTLMLSSMFGIKIDTQTKIHMQGQLKKFDEMLNYYSGENKPSLEESIDRIVTTYDKVGKELSLYVDNYIENHMPKEDPKQFLAIKKISEDKYGVVGIKKNGYVGTKLYIKGSSEKAVYEKLQNAIETGKMPYPYNKQKLEYVSIETLTEIAKEKYSDMVSGKGLPSIPYVRITHSELENDKMIKGNALSLLEADELFDKLDSQVLKLKKIAKENNEYYPYFKTGFEIILSEDGQKVYTGSYDIGDGDGTLLNHIESISIENIKYNAFQNIEADPDETKLVNLLYVEKEYQSLERWQKIINRLNKEYAEKSNDPAEIEKFHDVLKTGVNEITNSLAIIKKRGADLDNVSSKSNDDYRNIASILDETAKKLEKKYPAIFKSRSLGYTKTKSSKQNITTKKLNEVEFP